jgi:O-antigen/teichoic acid export membrane protein
MAQVSEADQPSGAVRTVDAAKAPESTGVGIDRLARDGLLGLVGAAASAVFNLVVVLLVVHSTAKATAGVVFAVTSLYLIAVTIARLGSPTGLVYYLVRATTSPTRSRRDTMRSIVRIGLRPVVVGSIVVAGILLASASHIAHWIAPLQASNAILPLRFLALLVPFAAISDTLLMGSRGFNTMRPLVLVERIGRPVGQVALTVVAVLIGTKGAVAFTMAWALPYVATAGVALWWTSALLRRAERRNNRKPDSAADSAADGAGDARNAGATTAREYWIYTAPRAMQSIVQIALQRLDIVLVSALVGPREAAVYAAVTRFLVFGQLGAQAITSAVQPQLGSLLFSGDRAGAGRVYQVSTCWLILLTWPVYLFLGVFAHQIPAFFGRGYDAGTAVLVILAGAMLIATGSGLVDVVLAMAGRTTWTLGNSVLALVVDVSLNFILLPRIGIMGAAIAWAAAIVANNILPLTQLAVALHLHPFGRGTLFAMASGGGWLGALPAAVGFATDWSGPALVVAMAIGVAGYLATAWRLRTTFDLDALLRAARRRGAGPKTPAPAVDGAWS